MTASAILTASREERTLTVREIRLLPAAPRALRVGYLDQSKTRVVWLC